MKVLFCLIEWLILLVCLVQLVAWPAITFRVLLTAHTTLGQQVSTLTMAPSTIPTTLNIHNPWITNLIASGVVTVWMSLQGQWLALTILTVQRVCFRSIVWACIIVMALLGPGLVNSLMFSLLTTRDKLYTSNSQCHTIKKRGLLTMGWYHPLLPCKLFWWWFITDIIKTITTSIMFYTHD